MRINVVYASTFAPKDGFDIETVKQIGPTWGSWRTWKTCNTDNVICHDIGHARELYRRNLQASCNLYLPETFYTKMSRPTNVQFYQGDFREDTQDLDDVVCMHLVGSLSDLVLMVGFDLSNPGPQQDRLLLRRLQNRLGLIRSCIAQTDQIQWVLVDHNREPDVAFQNLSNLTRDSFKNVLQLLAC